MPAPPEETSAHTAIIITTIAFFVMGLMIILIVSYARKRNNFHIQQRELLQARMQKNILQAQLEIQESVFNNISYEIHDNIGQVLSLVRLNLNTLGDSPSEERIQATDELLGQALRDLRSLSHTLNSERIIQLGLPGSIQQLLDNLEKSGKYKTSFQNQLPHLIVPRDQLIILFRIIQESIHNIVKHARASQIDVMLMHSDKAYILKVRDNGVGFNTQELDESDGGIGIANMKARMKMINGEFSIHSRPGEGAQVVLSWQKEN